MKYQRSANIIKFAQARFSWCTERLLRFEYSPQSTFEDRCSLSVSNREFADVELQAEHDGDTLIMKSRFLTVKFINDGQPFSKHNLHVSYSADDLEFEWNPELEDTGNLGGTHRTLDGYDGRTHKYNNEKIDLGKGLISRNGWAVLDDSENVMIDTESNWVTPRDQEGYIDLYLFAYGHDYKDALYDGAKLLGSQPLAPRYAFGYWWSKFWAYTDREIEKIISLFDQMNVPIDVMVIHMDWHLEGWGGYTWDKRYFPDPDDFLKKLHERGIKVTLNLHPASGVGKHEEQFEPMALAMGLDTSTAEHIDFDITDPKYMQNYFKYLHHPQEERGIDFWWMDWQQGNSSKMKGLDTLPWINHLHWQDMQKNIQRGNKRPLIFSRYGGPGAGRYAIGFSGDTISTWDSLEFQPYFTATASNILYGFWSHDIGGHIPGNIEPELYTRWMQLGLFSPVMRTHTCKSGNGERRTWEYPEPYNHIMMDVIKNRYNMVPYIYTEARKCHDTAISLCRPMYYDYPKEEDAYAFTGQYMFGDEFVIAPITTEISDENDLASTTIWLPEGKWYDTARGCFEQGGKAITRAYTLSEIPAFVRLGAIIPGQKKELRLNAKHYSNLTLSIYPGECGEYDLYEDDGITTDYENEKFTIIKLSHQRVGNKRLVTVAPTTGNHDGFEPLRSLRVYLEGSAPLKSVKIQNHVLKYDLHLGENQLGWRYDGYAARIEINIPEFDLTQGLNIDIEYDPDFGDHMLNGFKGIMTRFEMINRYATLSTGGRIRDSRERDSAEAFQTGNRIERNPQTSVAELDNLERLIDRLPAGLRALGEATRDTENSKYPLCLKAIAILSDIEAIMLRQ